MSRIFGCLCNQPERLIQALEPVRHVLSATAPVSRWGLGYVQSGEVLLSRHPRPTRGELDFFAALGDLKSDYVIGCAAGEDGWTGGANTQPYRFRRWLFAHTIQVDSPEAVAPALREHIPDFLLRNVKGKAPAELIFHMFLARLHDAGQIDDHTVDPGEIRRALAATLAQAGAAIAAAGVETTPGNVLVCNSRAMLAVRQGGPLYLRRLKQQVDPKRPDTEFKAVLVVDGDALPAEGFEELPQGSALLIGRDVTTDICDLSAP